MSALPAHALLSRDEARTLTDEVKSDAERMWRKLVELYDGCAWEALGYDSWRSYWITEFGEQKLSMGYRQIAAGRVTQVIGVAHGPQPNLRQARELAPLLPEPETLRKVWAEASAEGEPTAAQVREVVLQHRPTLSIPIDEEALAKQQRETMIHVLDQAVFALESPPSAARAEVARLLAEGDPGPFVPSRFDRVTEYASAFARALRKAGIDG